MNFAHGVSTGSALLSVICAVEGQFAQAFGFAFSGLVLMLVMVVVCETLDAWKKRRRA